MNLNPSFGWLSPKCRVAPSASCGLGVFAVEAIARGEIVCAAGGYILTTEDEAWFSGGMADKPVEIEDDFYIGPRTDGDIDLCPHVRINHSCDPNVGIKGQILYVAMRPISQGEEVCIDYAMHLAANPRSDLVFTFECRCGICGWSAGWMRKPWGAAGSWTGGARPQPDPGPAFHDGNRT